MPLSDLGKVYGCAVGIQLDRVKNIELILLKGHLLVEVAIDNAIRAFNKHTGKLLWEAALPAAGFATPSVYTIKGKQYIVIACGGGKLNAKSGDAYVAFALP